MFYYKCWKLESKGPIGSIINTLISTSFYPDSLCFTGYDVIVSASTSGIQSDNFPQLLLIPAGRSDLNVSMQTLVKAPLSPAEWKLLQHKCCTGSERQCGQNKDADQHMIQHRFPGHPRNKSDPRRRHRHSGARRHMTTGTGHVTRWPGDQVCADRSSLESKLYNI